MSQIKINTNFWVGLVVMFFVMIGLFYLAKGIFTLLAWAAPVLLILTIIIKPKILVQYGKLLLNLLKRNPILGVVAIILTVIGFPFVAAGLFGKALLDRKVDQIKEQHELREKGEFVDYEIIDEEPLELPNLEKKQSRNDYEDLL